MVALGDQVRETLKLGLKRRSIYTGYYMTYYDAACIHSALAKAALEHAAQPPTERRQLADHDIKLALELLDDARATGEFKGMIRRDEVRREILLDPLRSSPLVQLLILDLAFPDNPFGSR